MALNASDKREIENLIKKEVKDFIGSNTMKQYEDKIINIVAKELKKGKLIKKYLIMTYLWKSLPFFKKTLASFM